MNPAVADGGPPASAVLSLPPFQGSAFIDGQESGQSPLVALLEQLYSKDERTLARVGVEAGAQSASGDLPLPLDSLPVFTYEHECALLREPFGNGKGGMTRPCVSGDACIGMHKQLAGHLYSNGVVLSEMLTPAELETFMTDGTLPNADKRRMCVLCCRYHINSAYLFARKKRHFSSSHVFNNYVNVTDEPGEYRARPAVLVPPFTTQPLQKRPVRSRASLKLFLRAPPPILQPPVSTSLFGHGAPPPRETPRASPLPPPARVRALHASLQSVP
jgi:hypothetical protein